MMKIADNEQDKLLQDAMRRRAERVPSLSDDFAESVMAKMKVRRQSSRRTIFLWAGSVAAALLVGFFLFLNRPKEQPLMAQKAEVQTEQEVPAEKPIKAEPENIQCQVAQHPVPSPSTSSAKSVNSACLAEQPDVPCPDEAQETPLEEVQLAAETEAEDCPTDDIADMPDQLLMAAAQIRDIRSRGERLDREIALLMED
ncbi:MAG: hypothetical protein IKT83_02875 [Bacteroidaceae bacterium]|nr:hypothetical protein [Bacteroidaceae bacterium]